MFKRPDSGHLLELNGLPSPTEPDRTELLVRGFVVFCIAAIGCAMFFNTCLTS